MCASISGATGLPEGVIASARAEHRLPNVGKGSTKYAVQSVRIQFYALRSAERGANLSTLPRQITRGTDFVYAYIDDFLLHQLPRRSTRNTWSNYSIG